MPVFPDRLRFRGYEYAAAVFFAALMIGLRWAIDPWMGARQPLATLYGAVALTAWVGGYRPALLTVVLGYLACNWLFIEPRADWRLYSTADWIGLAVYLLSCFFIIMFGEGMRRADHRARKAEAALRARAAAQRLLMEINDATRGLRDPAEVIGQIVARVGRDFGVSRCLYVEVEDERTHATVTRDYVDGVQSVAGRHKLGAFSAALTADYQAGRIVVIEDVRRDERTRAPESLERLDKAGIRALVGVPVVKDGQLAGIFGVQHREPRRWSPDDVILVEQLAERTWLAVEGARAEAALRESEERFRHMADNAPVMVWVTEPDGACTFLSRSWYEFTGQTPETGLGFGWVQAVHPEDRPIAETEFIASNREQRAFRVEYRVRAANGEYRWAIDAAQPRFAADGRYLGYVGSVIDITERRTIEDALREADRRKDEFLATLAHELRNPLAPIRNAVEIFRLQEPANSALRGPRDIIDRQVRQLTRLVDDLMEASRISQGKVHLRRERIDVAVALESAVEGARPLIERGGHQLVVTPPAEPLEVDADPTRLTQIVLNLLNNAAKYTPRGGSIALSAAREGNDVVIRVRDSGIGISSEQMPALFRMFSQAAPALDRAQGGLGIGLALVRGFVELHGGRVSAHSDGLGRGSEFVVRLPLA